MKNYNVIIGSPVDYEELTADIVIDKKYVARVQKEEGNDKMVLEFFEESIKAKIYVDDFAQALQEAKSLLMK